jgi:polar amino acid transport system permease protein
MERRNSEFAADLGAFLSIAGLSKSFGRRRVLQDVSFDVAAGQTVAIIGPSGGGKSTMLRCLNGLVAFDEGAIRVGPHVLGSRRGGRSDVGVYRQVRRELGMVFQDFQLFPHLTALGNVVEAPLRVSRVEPDAARARARMLLDRVGLGDREDAYPHELSGGQKQRVAIARALAMEPRGLLCDEVTSALDPELKSEVLAVLEDLKRDGLTLVMVTHEIGFARRAADRVVVLAEGRVIEEGPADRVIAEPQADRTRQFLRCVLG